MTIQTAAATRAYVNDQLEELRRIVFDQPPSDWAGFQRLLGSYQALQRLQIELTPQPNGDDK